MTTTRNRWRGLKDLVQDAFENGATAIEKVHLGTAKRTFDVLELVEPLRAPIEGIREIHDTTVKGIYEIVRVVNRSVGKSIDAVFDVTDRASASERATPAGGPSTPSSPPRG